MLLNQALWKPLRKNIYLVAFFRWQVSTGCVSGCVCPDHLLADGKGDCVEIDNCTCTHDGLTYSPGDQIQDECNNWWAVHCINVVRQKKILIKDSLFYLYILSLYFSAHARAGCGLVQIRNVMAPAPSTGKVISRLSTASDILTLGTVNTS